ncbi:platelet glycoprotein Ib alpha chain-like isoform X2 [Schistocerca cancellata]|uniref:platelet glycoprotein Ib alpha chain-like isoform X2 n=1 Tax=Schistocerca cancellata TaxID=274614 RepID=UPI00211937EF|nr:platelet glycoprotein Ib alpha chain-like isoform X2 [Schistocerca cancellata]
MRLLVLLRLLAAVCASRLDLPLQQPPPEDPCHSGAAAAVLAANQLRVAPPCCPSFRGLFVHRNLITDIPEDWLLHCPHLEELDLSHNRLKELPPTFLETTTQLEELYLQGNSLVSIPEQLLATCSGLRQLWLSGNRLARLPAGLLAAVPRLRALRLDHNEVAGVDAAAFQGNQQLRVVDLSSNRLTSLPSGLFTNATSLRYLLLRDNRLRVVPPSGTLPERPISLDLRENHLQTVEDFGVFGSSRVWLDGNRWRCGCSLEPVLREAASVRQLRWFQQRPLCYQDHDDRRLVIEEGVSQCHISIMSSAGSATTSSAVHSPSSTTFDKTSSDPLPKSATPGAVDWRPGNNISQTATSLTSVYVSDAPYVSSPETPTPEIGSGKTSASDSSDLDTTTSEVSSSETGAPLTYSSETATSTIGSSENESLSTSYSETTTPDISNSQFDPLGTSETDTLGTSSGDTDTSPESGGSGSLSPLGSSTKPDTLLDPDYEVNLREQGSGRITYSTTNDTNNSAAADITVSSTVDTTSDINTSQTGSTEKDVTETASLKTTSTTVSEYDSVVDYDVMTY